MTTSSGELPRFSAITVRQSCAMLLSLQPIFILHRHMGESAHPSDEHMSHADTRNNSHATGKFSRQTRYGGKAVAVCILAVCFLTVQLHTSTAGILIGAEDLIP